MSDEILEKARQLRAAGASIEQVKQYLISKGYEVGASDDTIEVEAGYPERFATTLLKGAQVIPGMKSFEALAGSIGSKFTDHPVSYSDAKAGLEEQSGRMGAGRAFAAEAVSSPVMAPLMALRGISALSPAMQGAAYGGASQALDFNPDEPLESRLSRSGLAAAGGAVLGGTASGVGKLMKAPPGTVGKVVGAAMPDKLRRANRVWQAMSDASATPIVKPKVRLDEASAPKADGFIGNSLENLRHAAPSTSSGPAAPRATPTLEEVLSQATPAFKPRGRTKAQLEYFAERMAKRAAEKTAQPTGEVTDLALEDLLRLNLEHVKKGGSIKSAADALRIVRRP